MTVLLGAIRGGNNYSTHKVYIKNGFQRVMETNLSLKEAKDVVKRHKNNGEYNVIILKNK